MAKADAPNYPVRALAVPTFQYSGEGKVKVYCTLAQQQNQILQGCLLASASNWL